MKASFPTDPTTGNTVNLQWLHSRLARTDAVFGLTYAQGKNVDRETNS
jgi:hypothetical protein